MKHLTKLYGTYYWRSFYSIFHSTFDCGGDGGTTIICANPKEAAQNFLNWIKEYKNFDYQTQIHSDEWVNVGEYQEYWSFISFKEYLKLGGSESLGRFGEETYWVVEDCVDSNHNIILKGVGENHWNDIKGIKPLDSELQKIFDSFPKDDIV